MLMLLQPFQAQAANRASVEDAVACLNATTKLEEKYQIKEHLLTTISSVETGRWNANLQQSLAWPWTVNAQGKGNFYKSKEEAIAAVRRLQEQGVKSIDVGCMQINLMYHPDAFEDLEAAFDPETNVEYAAKFLKNLYENRDNDWIKAAMAYHSSAPQKAQRYKTKLVSAYEKVKQAQNSLRKHKLVAGGSTKGRKVANLKKIPTSVERQNRLIADAKAWREAKLEEYRRNRAEN